MIRIFLCLLVGLAVVAAAPAAAFDPLTAALGKGIAMAMDARSSGDVKADVEIDAAITKKLLEQKGEAFKDISVLVFARHAVLVGFAANEEVKARVEGLAKGQARLRSLQNDIVVAKAGGGLAANAVLDKKIDLTLTATRGVSSVNMRWKVYGGDVFLMGLAGSRGEANLAVTKIRGLDGVKNVHSSLRVGKK